MAREADRLAGYWELQKFRRKRAVHLVLCVFFSLVFLWFAVGTTWSLTTSDHPWADGELTGSMVTIAVSAPLAVFTGFRARRFARLARERRREQNAASWIPDESGAVSAEAEAQIPRLRTIAKRTVAVVAAWGVVLLLGVGGFVLLDAKAEYRLEHGSRTTGTVMAVYNPGKGTPSIDVRYSVGETGRTATIYRDSGRKYANGDQVTVVYDPADPADVRTIDERNDNLFVRYLSYSIVLAGAIGMAFSAGAARGWQRRYRAVRTTGWRQATADVSQPRKSQAKITVYYPDGTWVALTAVASSYAARIGDLREVPVWVGGEGWNMVVLLPRGRGREGLHPVPVRAVAPRTAGGARPRGTHSR